MKNFNFDSNGHMVSYENDQGGTTIDYDYLAEKQAKANAKAIANSQSANTGASSEPVDDIGGKYFEPKMSVVAFVWLCALAVPVVLVVFIGMIWLLFWVLAQFH